MLGEGDTFIPQRHMPPYRPLLPSASRFGTVPRREQGPEGEYAGGDGAAAGAEPATEAAPGGEAEGEQGLGGAPQAGAEQGERGPVDASGSSSDSSSSEYEARGAGPDGAGAAELAGGAAAAGSAAAAAAAVGEPAASAAQEEQQGEGEQEGQEAGAAAAEEAEAALQHTSSIGRASTLASSLSEGAEGEGGGDAQPSPPLVREEDMLPPESFDMEQERSGPIHFT